MKYIGYVALLAGLLLLMNSFFMETAVTVDYNGLESYGLPEKVNNLGLMQEK